MRASGSRVSCVHCGEAMEPGDGFDYPGGGPRVEMFQCPAPGCGHKAAVMFEPAGQMTEDHRAWVEREVGRRGAFFPSDWSGGARSRFGR